MKSVFLHYVFFWVTLQLIAVPATVLNCCEGDILLLLDSSGSIANYEFSRLSFFAADLLRPFSLGRGHVRVGLLQVGTDPHLEFGLDVHSNQESLQSAMQGIRQLKGDTNTEAALGVARELLTETDVKVPKILLWLTDGVQPGDVDRPMSELKMRGVSVLIVSTVHGNYQVLKRVVTPPLDSHLYSVDIDNIDIITEDLRKAMIDVLSPAVVHLSDHGPHQIRVSWGPLQLARVQQYTVEYGAIPSSHVRTVTLPRHKNSTLLTGLEPGTQYLVTVTALQVDGKERAMSVRACTLAEALPALIDLQLEPVKRRDLGVEEMQVKWQASQGGLRGYWIKWETENPHSTTSSMYLPPSSRSTQLTHLAPNSRVCVSPIYSSGRGDGLCCTATTHRDSRQWG
ncbi:von Willebrand factor A domain-containing protein 1 isoform X2 [Maylandia zebra]|uniref:von Willebrand factor A domain-containing protein 1 isoform X2 n=1 Tax=Maylandia zebra TaxID=106582 RepID=UPI00403C45A6